MAFRGLKFYKVVVGPIKCETILEWVPVIVCCGIRSMIWWRLSVLRYKIVINITWQSYKYNKKKVSYWVKLYCTYHSVWGGIWCGIGMLDLVQSQEKVSSVVCCNVEFSLMNAWMYSGSLGECKENCQTLHRQMRSCMYLKCEHEVQLTTVQFYRVWTNLKCPNKLPKLFFFFHRSWTTLFFKLPASTSADVSLFCDASLNFKLQSKLSNYPLTTCSLPSSAVISSLHGPYLWSLQEYSG